MEFLVILLRKFFIQRSYPSLQIRSRIRNLLQFHTFGALQNDCSRLVWHFKHTYYLGNCTDGM